MAHVQHLPGVYRDPLRQAILGQSDRFDDRNEVLWGALAYGGALALPVLFAFRHELMLQATYYYELLIRLST